MNWQIEKGVRCDLACYAARNLTGKRHPVRIFPGGNRQGNVPTGDLSSVLIRAPYGTRVIFITNAGPSWQEHPWRCVRLIEGSSLRASGVGLPGVRLPDLDRLDHHGAKTTDRELEVSYPMADTLDAGEGWTFGRIGELKKKVVLIRVEKDRAPIDADVPLPEAVAQGVFTRLIARDPGRRSDWQNDVSAALQRALVDAGEDSVEARIRTFEQWAEEQ